MSTIKIKREFLPDGIGGGGDVAISTTQPINNEVLWINPNEVPSGVGSYISNTYGESQEIGYSQEFVNDIKDELRNLMKFSDWTNLYSSGNNYVKYRYNAFICEVFVFLESTHSSDFTAGTLPSACRPSNRADQELTGAGLNYGRVETNGNVVLHNENAYATGTFTFTLTN